jgi:hypothetical protein
MNDRKVQFIGNHANLYLKTQGTIPCESMVFKPSTTIESAGGNLCLNQTSMFPVETYERGCLKEQIESLTSASDRCILVGDPSELLVEASIEAGLSHKNLDAVFFVYPVGMAALDIRKEIAEMVWSLKKNEVPTFLIRFPERVFGANEPNLSMFVKALSDPQNMQGIEYLCGVNQSSL